MRNVLKPDDCWNRVPGPQMHRPLLDPLCLHRSCACEDADMFTERGRPHPHFATLPTNELMLTLP